MNNRCSAHGSVSESVQGRNPREVGKIARGAEHGKAVNRSSSAALTGTADITSMIAISQHSSCEREVDDIFMP
jgi:hypothetical protein